MNIIAIDVGLKRIGVAALVSGMPVVCEPIFRKNREQASSDVSSMLKTRGASKLIVGLPKGGAGEEEMERRIRHFVSLLDFAGEVYYVDEYGSSKEALELVGGGLTKKKDGKSDSLAALVILKRWANLM